ncbi:B3 domain-containing protein Os06g0194400-like isoform X2 [Diospyros lotus]|uniref:B3 domain-containing protein Os06g0194400-like isoform X2 n=1 Tax=Diospyros lotus TaxID=55363 RepID=UPI002257FC31|nr:B3 domain-containing protein Os06g0194400-like isoform X2 [Diospyros lotus]
MVLAKVTYEELRRQRVEENRKKLEELRLPYLSQNLREEHSPLKPSPVKRATPRIVRKETVAVRRSRRIADKPAPQYKEVVIYERIQLPRSGRNYKRRDLSNRVYASDEVRTLAIEKAEHLESNLEADYPTFVKPMTQSHVTGGFWLGLPSGFCRRNLPRSDQTVTLIDERAQDYPTVYLARKCGLSGGWRGFSIDHELVDGDALVFQLINPTTFKVYIIRANSFKE